MKGHVDLGRCRLGLGSGIGVCHEKRTRPTVALNVTTFMDTSGFRGSC
jgi:hypothetical protein